MNETNKLESVNTDLQRERETCSFSVKELTTLFDGGAQKTVQRKEREELLKQATVLFEGVPEEYLSHKEKYEDAIKKSVALFSIVRKMQKEGKTDLNNYREVIGGLLSSAPTRDGSALGIHYVMFMPAILNQGTQAQQDYWLRRAFNCSILGSYAQTELGHGTFIRGLETTATYDPTTQEFILNTPTLTSYKWWPGGLGHTANYSIVVAQLYTKGKCHGVHSFMLQVRDEETHMPLPGIKIGDIGAKLGLNTINNGFLGLDNVRIPRKNMLMKHAQVLEDGTYVKSPNNKLIYGAMVFVRVVIVFDMVNHLTKAVTIATRYSAVRRQCQLTPNEPEVQILDYVTQQHKIFIGIATCYALKITGNMLWDTFNEVNTELIKGNMERLPELHALACCLKAVSTTECSRLVTSCRLACGGHGFMHSSNLPMLHGQATAACTYEGDNTVLLLQTARFLMKSCQQRDKVKLTPTIAYMEHAASDGYCGKWQNNVDTIIKGFQMVSTRKTASCVEIMQRRVASGKAFADAWNSTSVQLVAAAEAHCRVIIVSTFNAEVKKMSSQISQELQLVMQQLNELYAVYYALENLDDLFRYTPITKQDAVELQGWYEDLLQAIRPNAVGLVDAFDIQDAFLQSALGAYDGRVYERLMEEALKSPLNKQPVNDSFHKYLKPFMQGKL